MSSRAKRVRRNELTGSDFSSTDSRLSGGGRGGDFSVQGKRSGIYRAEKRRILKI